MLAAILATQNSGTPPAPAVVTDPFDKLMISTCSILSRAAGSADSYGQTPRTLETLEAEVPCRVSRLDGEEQKGRLEFSTNRRKIYMRPWAFFEGEGISPRSAAEAVGSLELNPSMWIQVGSIKYDIIHVANPSLMYHHFEVLVEQVMS